MPTNRIGLTVACKDQSTPKFDSRPVQISLEPRPARVVKPKIDYHCTECGYTGKREEHVCNPTVRIGYVETRGRMCHRRCPYALDGVCTLLKSLHPDRDCIIDIGIEMPEAWCPAGLWPRVQLNCPQCGSVTFSEKGVGKCGQCGFTPENKIIRTPVIRLKDELPLEGPSRYAIVTMAIGQKTLELNQITGPQMRRYAEACGVDYHEITDDQSPNYPLGNKFRLQHLTANYDRILFLDADIWVKSSTPNLFLMLQEGYVWMHEDGVLAPGMAESEAGIVSKEQQIEKPSLKIYNTGVVMFDNAHRDMWSPPPLPAPYRHVTEQTWVEVNMILKGCPVKALPSEFNCQWWFNRHLNLSTLETFESLVPRSSVIHLASSSHGEKMYRMNKLAFEDRAKAVLDIHAVTSLSEKPHHIARQSVCLSSWKAFGLPIIVVNKTDEIDRLSELYPQVDRWVACDDNLSIFTRQTQQIERLSRVAIDIDKPVMLLNSDIELFGDRSLLLDRLKPNCLVGGIRWNYESILAKAVREDWGIDAFVVTPEMAKTIPASIRMQIGIPFWDYWLPLHFQRIGYEIDLIGERLLYHRSHDAMWGDDDWCIGAKVLDKEFGTNLFSTPGSIAFRQTLPFPPV